MSRLWALGLACAVLGCGPSEPATYPVSGTVTWNGKPLPAGTINLLPDGASLKIDPGRVADGKFEFRATAGAKRVEIWADREVAGQEHVKVMGLRAREQYLPPKYNGRTELTCVVTPEGPNEFRFELTEK